MRDGRVRSYTVNASPHDAIGALAELPPVEEGP
jgi:hypothetical protein